jgi:hypothetical protein
MLADKLNELIPIEKEKELERIMKENRLQRVESAEREWQKEEMALPAGGAQFPIAEPEGVIERQKRAAEDQEAAEDEVVAEDEEAAEDQEK